MLEELESCKAIHQVQQYTRSILHHDFWLKIRQQTSEAHWAIWEM
jgi:hypothetical protein